MTPLLEFKCFHTHCLSVCMCMHMCMNVCVTQVYMCAWYSVWRPEDNLRCCFSNAIHSFCFVLETRSRIDLNLLSRLGWPGERPRHPTVAHAVMPRCFSRSVLGLNSGPHACQASYLSSPSYPLSYLSFETAWETTAIHIFWVGHEGKWVAVNHVPSSLPLEHQGLRQHLFQVRRLRIFYVVKEAVGAEVDGVDFPTLCLAGQFSIV